MKKLFAKKLKEPTAEERREALESAGIPTKYSSSRTSKFSQYSDYANQLNAKNGRGVPGPNQNPYAAAASGAPQSTPYGGAPAPSNAYGGQMPPGPSYGQQPQGSSLQPYGGNNQGRVSPSPSYRTTASASPYASAETDYNNRYGGTKLAPQPSTDTFEASRNQLFGNAAQQQQQAQQPPQQQPYSSNGGYGNTNNGNSYHVTPDRAALFGAAINNNSTPSAPPPTQKNPNPNDELLMTSSELEQSQASDPRYSQNRYNVGSSYGESSTNGNGNYGDEDKEYDSEDGAVEAIRSQVKFLNKQTVDSSREALMAASRAEESGRQTLGMLGSQGESIANTERSLALANTQNKIAEEKARELKTLNRSMFAVHVANPFNSRRRLQEKEDQIKQSRRMDQLDREDRRAQAYESQKRITDGLAGDRLAHSETAQKYASQRNREQRQKYMVDGGDSEDEEIENEIDRNLDALSSASSRLHNLALTANAEIKDHNRRLADIADATDNLDVNVHLNTNRLMNIR